MSRRLISLILLASAIAACAGPPKLRDFSTDGCSLFPDGELTGDRTLWCDCCLAHDMAYWRGGTEVERLRADEALRDCVRRKTGDAKLANLMHHGVRAGGSPVFPTWYRWAYGWSYGRGYEPLTAEEEREATLRMQRYRETHAATYCER